MAETHDKRTETHACDLISRQAAIEALNEYFSRIGKLKRRGLSNAEKAISLDTVGAIKSLPPAQPSATDTNVATTDTISRAAVVDAIEGVDWYHINKSGEMVHGANNNDHQAWYKAEDIYKAVESVPSAPRIPWDRKTRNSMAGTLQMLRRLAYNIHGVMDVIDDGNVNRLIEWLEGGH